MVKRIALALPGTREEGHRNGPWFNIGKRPFLLYWGRSGSWMIRLPPEHVLMLRAVGAPFRPMKHGSPFWIYIDVEAMDAAMIRDYLAAAWRCTAPKKLQEGVLERDDDIEEDRELQGEAFA